MLYFLKELTHEKFSLETHSILLAIQKCVVYVFHIVAIRIIRLVAFAGYALDLFQIHCYSAIG